MLVRKPGTATSIDVGALAWTEVLRQHLLLIFGPPAVMLFAFILDNVTLGTVLSAHCALVPRTLDGMVGIFLSPLVHASVAHVACNMYGWIGLAAALGLFGVEEAWMVIQQILVGTGLCVWACGRSLPHEGASGVEFGLIGFLLAVVFYERPLQLRSVAVFVFLVATYAPALLSTGLFLPFISWESHMCGFVVGAVAAFLRYGATDKHAGCKLSNSQRGYGAAGLL